MAKIIKVRIVGIGKGVLMHNPAAMQRGGKGGLGTKKILPPDEEAEAGAYRDEKGNFYLPTAAFRSAIIGKGGAASSRRIGKRSAISCVSAGFFIQTDQTPLVHPATNKPLSKFEIDTRRAVVQGNGILRSRPLVVQWACVLVCEVDEDFVTVNQIIELLNIAGRVSGVGDFRPQCKGVFGRFTAELVAA